MFQDLEREFQQAEGLAQPDGIEYINQGEAAKEVTTRTLKVMAVEPHHFKSGCGCNPLKIARRSDIDRGLGLNRTTSGRYLARGICLAGS